MMRGCALLLMPALVASACGSAKKVPSDAGYVDAGTMDAGEMDAGVASPFTAIAREQTPSTLAITATAAIWGSSYEKTVLSAPLQGGGAVAALVEGDSTHAITAVTASGGNIYWAASDGTVGGAGADGSALPVVSGFQQPQSLLVLKSVLYVADAAANCVWSLPLPLTGAAPTVLASNVKGARVLTTDGTALYVAAWGSDTSAASQALRHDGTVSKVSLTNGTVTPLAVELGRPSGLAIVNGTLFWTAFDDNTISALVLDSSTSTVLAMNRAAPAALVADAHSLYWVEDGLTSDNIGGVYSMPLGGGAVTTIAPERANPVGIAVDDTNVYWAELGDPTVREGGVWSAKK